MCQVQSGTPNAVKDCTYIFKKKNVSAMVTLFYDDSIMCVV